MTMMQPPTFTLHTDPETGTETITVDFLPPVLRIDDRCLRDARRDLVEWRGEDRIRIRCENAECTYRLLEHDSVLRRSLWQAEGG